MEEAESYTIGPKLDELIQQIGVDLLGKTVLEEPYVSKKTLLQSIRHQNNILRTFQSSLLEHSFKLNEIAVTLQENKKSIDYLTEKSKIYDTYLVKVDKIEETIDSWREKIALVDVLDKKVKHHDQELVRVHKDIKLQGKKLFEFKVEAKKEMGKLRGDLDEVCVKVAEMPQTIVISSHQVKCPNNLDEKIGTSSSDETATADTEIDSDKSGSDHRLLRDVISEHETKYDLLERMSQDMDRTIQSHSITVSKVENEMTDNISQIEQNLNEVIEWKEGQQSVDLQDIRRSQDTIELTLQSLEHDLLDKTSRQEVQDKLDTKFDEIVLHLNTALVSTQKDEEDFKAVTASLNKKFQQLQDIKADQNDIRALRKEFIDNQIEASRPPSFSKSVSTKNEDILNLLAKYPTHDFMDRMLDQKMDKDITFSRLDRTDAHVLELERALQRVMKRPIPDLLASQDYSSSINDKHHVKTLKSNKPASVDDANDNKKLSSENDCKNISVSQPTSYIQVDKTCYELDYKQEKTSPRDTAFDSIEKDIIIQNSNDVIIPELESEQKQQSYQKSDKLMRKQRNSSYLNHCESNDIENNNKTKIKGGKTPILLPTSKTNLVFEPPSTAAQQQHLKQQSKVSVKDIVSSQKASVGNSDNNEKTTLSSSNLSKCKFELAEEEKIMIDTEEKLEVKNSRQNRSSMKVPKSEKEPLRALSQYQTPVPVNEEKEMVSGDNGQLYISSRKGAE